MPLVELFGTSKSPPQFDVVFFPDPSSTGCSYLGGLHPCLLPPAAFGLPAFRFVSQPTVYPPLPAGPLGIWTWCSSPPVFSYAPTLPLSSFVFFALVCSRVYPPVPFPECFYLILFPLCGFLLCFFFFVPSQDSNLALPWPFFHPHLWPLRNHTSYSYQFLNLICPEPTFRFFPSIFLCPSCLELSRIFLFPYYFTRQYFRPWLPPSRGEPFKKRC